MNWGVPQGVLVANGERGFLSKGFAHNLCLAGSTYIPSKAFASWQKGKCESRVQTFKNTLEQAALFFRLKGAEHMTTAGMEAINAINRIDEAHQEKALV